MEAQSMTSLKATLLDLISLQQRTKLFRLSNCELNENKLSSPRQHVWRCAKASACGGLAPMPNTKG